MAQFEVYHEAVAAHYDLIAAGIIAHNAARTGEAQGRPLTVLARPDAPELESKSELELRPGVAPRPEPTPLAETVVGGLWGEVFWGWLKVELLWVREDQRGRGLGRQLLRRAEAEARAAGARAAHLSTFSFQALEFYQKEGYEIFGTLPDFPPGHARYYLKKQLAPA